MRAMFSVPWHSSTSAALVATYNAHREMKCCKQNHWNAATSHLHLALIHTVNESHLILSGTSLPRPTTAGTSASIACPGVNTTSTTMQVNNLLTPLNNQLTPLKNLLTPHPTSTHAVRIPMVMRGPGIKAGTTFELPASNVDVAPTLLGLAGIDSLVRVPA